ncbi:uncharacterized protein LOC124133555 [Haliotis rufescens]|uniref:uncharacterized protein LOC124133555 n=1 Tax=Haliotis rufescens TaxID=6454 RepID=UPI00201ED1BA|nr:uncharacterized protein LOC124133555 [Haliotis rufescens]
MMMLILLALVMGVARCSLVTNCTDFNPAVCQPDLIVYCFTDGTTAQGSCEANDRICFENATLSGDNSCFSTMSSTLSTTTTTSQNDNGGTVLSPQLVLVLMMMLAVWLGLDKMI